MGYKGQLITSTLVFSINISYIAYYYTIFGHVEIIELIGLPTMVLLAWWFGRQYDRAKFYAERDVLTGVYNRRFAYNFISKLKNKDKPFTILILDVNNFKYINDTFGHYSGDRALWFLSQALKRCTDKKAVISRWGGDEFLLILLTDNCDQIEALISRIQSAIHEELENYPNYNLSNVGVSIGFALYPKEGITIDELICVADQRMYQIKKRAGQSEHQMYGR
ncbi:MAG: GGDEF domain-containing protein [Ectobacillus sp.]